MEPKQSWALFLLLEVPGMASGTQLPDQRVSEWIPGKSLIIVPKEHKMLKIIDPGCTKHNWRQFTFDGVAAELMGDILSNLPNDGDSHTFICEHGHTHHISFNIEVEKCYRLSARFSGKEGFLGHRNQNRPMQTDGIPTTL